MITLAIGINVVVGIATVIIAKNESKVEDKLNKFTDNHNVNYFDACISTK